MSGAQAIAAVPLGRALIVLALATTIIVATEFIVVGLLPVLAADLDVSLSKAGHLVGAFAFSAAILGPPLTLVAARLPPSYVMAATLLLFGVGNLVAVLSPTYPTLLTVRVIQGAALPLFISVGTATITILAPAAQRGRMLALANIGFTLGLVVALPAGVALADQGRWSISFVTLALLSVAAAALTLVAFPRVSLRNAPTIKGQAGLLLRLRFVSHLLLSVTAFAAMFASYTYLTAWLEGHAGLESHAIAPILVFFGAAGLIGNMAVAALADRDPIGCTMISLFAGAVGMIGASLVAGQSLSFYLLLGLWGVAHTAAVTACQVRVTLAGSDAPAFAMAMNISSANLGIALGALAGGLVVDRWGIAAIGWGTAVLVLVSAGVATATRLMTRREDKGLAVRQLI